MNGIKGIITTLVTPLTNDYEIDEQKFKSLMEFQLANGIHGVVITGSVGEASLLSLEERKRLFKIAVESIGGRVPVICGVSSVRTEDAVELSKYSKDIGADAVMAVSSFYYRLSDEEVYNYFAAIAKVGLPVMLYNNPSTSKIDVSTDLVNKLALDCPNISYVKDSTGDLRRTRELIERSEGKYTTLCGTDDLSYESFVAGAEGWVSGIANIIPKQCVELWNIVKLKQDLKSGSSLNSKLYRVFALGEKRNFVQFLKEGLKIVGMDVGPARKPLEPLDRKEHQELSSGLHAIGADLLTAVASD